MENLLLVCKVTNLTLSQIKMNPKYRLIGIPVKYYGKTLWEIVGNLKNFGVGRLFIKDTDSIYPETSFYKIVKVQALVPDKREGWDRKCMVWAEAVISGKRQQELHFIQDESSLAKYKLVPKSEESKYLNYVESTREIIYPMYQSWPPVYKMLWEQRNPGKTIPPLQTVLPPLPPGSPDDIRRVSEEPSTAEQLTTTMFPTEKPIADLYREFYELQKKNNDLPNDKELEHKVR